MAFVPMQAKMWVAKFTKKRRDFGIASGILFIAHSNLSAQYFGLFTGTSAPPLSIFFGVVASWVFLALLLTSNQLAVFTMKSWWKRVHNLVWFALPLVLIHGVMASLQFSGEWSKITLVAFGGMMMFAVAELIAHQQQEHKQGLPASPQRWRHLSLVGAGVVAACALFVLYPKKAAEAPGPSASPVASTLPAAQGATGTTKSMTTGATASAQPSPTSQVFTTAQLATHHTANDCYVAFKGVVYNITSYVPRHPGGPGIVKKCGQVLDSFSELHPGGSFDSPKAQQALKALEVGALQ
jgi:hypothetical protein